MTEISGTATHPDPETLTAAELRHLGLPVPEHKAAEERAAQAANEESK